MRWTYCITPLGFVLAAVLILAGRTVGLAQQSTPAADTLLVIEEFEIPHGVAVTAAIDEASQQVRAIRQTGEFNTARLYAHTWGPKLAMYIVLEPKSWAALKAGTDKLFAARPEMRTAPFKWAGHSDNILTEVPVR
jgi:hypothetical protein